MNPVFELLEDPRWAAAAIGFLTYTLFTVWRKASARWINWFPLLTKISKLTLYGLAIVLALWAIQVVSTPSEQPLVYFFAAGVLTAPFANALARTIRPKEKIRRGTRIGLPSDVNKMTKKLPKEDFKDSFDIADVQIPRSVEPYHFFVVGATGSGKSVAIKKMLDEIEARGDVALIVDSGGDFASRYFKQGRDYLLNPFDDRCVPWSPTAEMAGPWDAEALAKSMIPDGVGESKEWNGYAQTLVTSVLRQLVERNRLSIKDMLYYVQAASMEELAEFLAGTPAAAQLVSEKTFGSIRTIAANYLSTYAYLEDHANPFSISRFISEQKSGFLFLTYRDAQLDSLRNMISCALDVAARAILSMEPAKDNRRVWLIIDEFASIGKVQSIEQVATKARKMGGCLLLGLQSVSQLKDRYGEHAAQTILSCLSSWLVLRCSDVDTAEYISKYIGEAEISRMTRGESSSDGGGTDSLNEQIQTQRAVMPVELQKLANLQGFFKLAGDYPICSVRLTFPAKREQRTESMKARDFLAKPMLKLNVDASRKPGDGAQHQAVTTADVKSTEATAQSMGEPAPQPPLKLKKIRTALEQGPEELLEVLQALAEDHEHGI